MVTHTYVYSAPKNSLEFMDNQLLIHSSNPLWVITSKCILPNHDYQYEARFNASVRKCKCTNERKFVLFFCWHFNVPKNECDGNLFAAARQKICSNYDRTAECHCKPSTLLDQCWINK